MSELWTIVPVKDTRHSKQRLAGLLGARERQSLALAMLEDVLEALSRSRVSRRLALVTVDPAAKALAHRFGARTIADGAADGHTGAVAGAARRLDEEGAKGFLTLPGDVPCVTHEEIDTLIAAHAAAPAFTIAPSHDEQGSNAVAISPPGAVGLRFGSDSFFPHLAAARLAGIEPMVVRLPGLALDIDTPDDLARFHAMRPPRGACTRALLATLPNAAHAISGAT